MGIIMIYVYYKYIILEYYTSICQLLAKYTFQSSRQHLHINADISAYLSATLFRCAFISKIIRESVFTVRYPHSLYIWLRLIVSYFLLR